MSRSQILQGQGHQEIITTTEEPLQDMKIMTIDIETKNIHTGIHMQDNDQLPPTGMTIEDKDQRKTINVKDVEVGALYVVVVGHKILSAITVALRVISGQCAGKSKHQAVHRNFCPIKGKDVPLPMMGQKRTKIKQKVPLYH